MSPFEPPGSPAAVPVVVVLVTAPDAETGARLARSLVAEGLVACVNLVPEVRSIYRWQGEVQEETEVLLVMKTRADRLDILAERVRALHPYELPEVVALAAAGGSAPYLDWVRSEAAP
ncbi:MAG TPA: divalent-cation tolerance protein CutA [Myxococcota bacterium]|jgi:periplasmic divalent cation tolerance protein|nr:divalent-cation tolerance protein CutA [Myxococcota bacterium]